MAPTEVSVPAPGLTGSSAASARRGPFSRWPRSADAVLALLLLGFVISFEEGPGDSLLVRTVAELPIPVVLLFVVASGALYWRRVAPIVVLAVVLGTWILTLGSGFADLGGHAIVGVYSAARYARPDRAGHLGLDAALVVLVLDGLTGPNPWSDVAAGAVVMLLAWYVGRRLRLRVERAEQQRRDQAALASRIVTEERTRIARELHDVVAHRVSLMTVQAGAARMVAAEDLEGAIRAMGAVETAGRQALDELRHLLGVLRPDAPSAGGRLADDQPQPGLADLTQLVEQMRQAGLEVALTLEGVPPVLPTRVELSAYRIVQESLTNVVKHAGPGAKTCVRLSADSRCLTVEVTDDGLGATVLPGSSHGIIGMRERAHLLGGTLEVGPCAERGFSVRAQLPMSGVTA